MIEKNAIKISLIEGDFHLTLTDGDFTNDTGFESAINTSLFSNSRADESQIGPPEKRSGWLGNLVSDVKNREIGGLLYLAEQRRLTQDAVNENVDFASKSLKWFVEDGLAKSIDVSGEIIPKFGIRLAIKTKTSLDTTTFYVNMWEFTANV